MSQYSPRVQEATLLDLLDRVIDNGVILAGDLTISVADVDLIYLGLRVLLAPAKRVAEMQERAMTIASGEVRDG